MTFSKYLFKIISIINVDYTVINRKEVDKKFMKLLYGTTNISKIEFMKKRLNSIGIEIISLMDISSKNLNIDESGNNPLENARIKAQMYYKEFNMPVFSCDSGLYFDKIDEKYQPGVHIRRVNGKNLSDDEMIKYYGNLAKKFGGEITARYKNAICLILDNEHIYEHMESDIESEPFIITSILHDIRKKGFPLDSLSIQIESGKYYLDLEKYNETDGFLNFFKRTLKIN